MVTYTKPAKAVRAAFSKPRQDRVLSPIPTQVARFPATPNPPLLDAFISAASPGKLLWAALVEGRLEVRSGATPDSAVSDQIGRLFVEALRAQFGDAASAIAERECKLGLQPRRLLPARTVRRAVACAESAFSLLMAQSHLLQIECSAVMMGWRFRRIAESVGLDPQLLPVERRQALDVALEPDFRSPLPVDADVVAARIRAWLMQSVH